MRRFALVAVAIAVVAAPAGAATDGSWVRHRAPGFTIALPASWADAGADRARLLAEARRLMRKDPRLGTAFNELLAASNRTDAVKMIAFDLSPESLRSGYATNLNVVRGEVSVPFAVWKQGAVRGLMTSPFVRQPIWSRTIRLPAGKALRLTYRAVFPFPQRRVEVQVTQYGLVERGWVTVLTFSTPPARAKVNSPLFERSARSLRLR